MTQLTSSKLRLQAQHAACAEAGGSESRWSVRGVCVSDGSWSVTLPELEAGTHTITAVATLSGVSSAESPARTLEVEAKAEEEQVRAKGAADAHARRPRRGCFSFSSLSAEEGAR